MVERILDTPQGNELIIKVDSCGVCGTDFHIYHGTAPAKNNTVLVHEFSGVIVDKGKDCYDFTVGDKVVIDPNIYCGKCSYCKEGKCNSAKTIKLLVSHKMVVLPICFNSLYASL